MSEVSVNNTVEVQETEYTRRMKTNYGFFAPVTFIYAVFYAFCMYKNGSGITFPFFVAGSLFYLCFCLSKLEISLQKNSGFHMVSMMLLAVSTFCTDDGKIIAMNKTGIFFLMMSLMLHQFYQVSDWKLGKFLWSILELVFCSIGELARPFSDKKYYDKSRPEKNKTLGYVLWGLVIALPLLLIVLGLLGSADVVFRNITKICLEWIDFQSVSGVLFRVGFIFFVSYSLFAFLCKKTIREDVPDKRNGEPVLAITVTALLSVVYILFSGIQIVYLFLGQMELPHDYTYAMYAREGFFQLLTVSVLNLIIVLVVMNYFKENRALKVILTIMSLCTFVMILSSTLRMIMYIRYYYMTFLRIFVLWALIVLFALFIGVIISIYKEKFPLFRYSMVVITVLYIALSFSHPDFIVAKVNVANISSDGMNVIDRTEEDFFQNTYGYNDFRYLSGLSADAAPVLIPYMEKEGYDLSVFYGEDIHGSITVKGQIYHYSRGKKDEFGYYYLENLQEDWKKFSLRNYNISRHMAFMQIQQ